MNGVLVIDKPAGLTSHDVVAQVRRILHVPRVGHTGTLDPFATGVLVVLLGRATRLAQFLSGVDKEYEAVIRLGFATETGDASGKRLNEGENFTKPGPWTREQIEQALESLRGEIDQVPPMYSAKKQGGRKLYELARQGQEVERAPVRVHIYKFESISDLPKDNLDGTFDLQVRVVCSAGTYVRTLAEDFGKHLHTGAHLAELRRTRAGDLLIDQASTLEQIKEAYADEALGKLIHPPDQVLKRMPFLDLDNDSLKRILNGLDIEIARPDWVDGERVRIRDAHQELIAIGVFNSTKRLLHPAVVLGS
ncbi:MAG TPA: tRNA pseudouridine(55) synthase TruB [Pyrinomonadaceae bacterium]|nr:tRNA pseudouridine(55) synthase TruB [Pyrinomonadaceae bacterium]